MHWRITPHADRDYDCCVLPAENNDQHRAALEYAQRRLEDAWDYLDVGMSVSVTMELCVGDAEDHNDE